jgi:uncharacterized membrane protein
MESAETLAARYLARNATIDIGRCISRGINLVTSNLGLVVGSGLLAFAIAIGINFVPILGWIASFFIGPALVAGLYMVLLKRLRGQEAAVGDIFMFFDYTMLTLAMASILVGVLVSIGMIFLILPGIYLAVAYIFTVPLIADKKLEFWTAMELSRKVVTTHWFSALGLIIVAGIIAALGVLALVVGLVVTAPIAGASLAVAYEDLFGDEKAEVASAA